jgi:hypothetical protein
MWLFVYYLPAAQGGMQFVEFLFQTNLVALVGAAEQPNLSVRRLYLHNAQLQQNLRELNFNSAILAVQLNTKRLVVTLEKRIHIFDFPNATLLHSLDTKRNPQGNAHKIYEYTDVLNQKAIKRSSVCTTALVFLIVFCFVF